MDNNSPGDVSGVSHPGNHGPTAFKPSSHINSLGGWTFSAWPLFLVFLVANSLLSYAGLEPWQKAVVILVGLLLPFALALKLAPLLSVARRTDDPLPRFTLWAVAAILLVAAFFRFYRLTRLSGWPLMDEGMTSYLAMIQLEKWNWNLFEGMTQLPSLFYWLLAGYFKIAGVSLHSLWLFPALLSYLSVPLAYLAVLPFGGRSKAVLGASLFGLCFWSFYLGRFCIPHALLVDWELGTFSLLLIFA